VTFMADNPGIWSGHCHNLKHANEGLVVHLMYDGVSTPYAIGKTNHPE
jgi:FtsP/CotA-like multicopper oxidase with cupredoxin domain